MHWKIPQVKWIFDENKAYGKSLANAILPFMKQNSIVKLFEKFLKVKHFWEVNDIEKRENLNQRKSEFLMWIKNKLISKDKSSGKTTYSEHSPVLF